MSVLFLDPLVLALVLGLVVYVCLVWRGWYRRWFGRSSTWTAFAWPLPLVVLAVPMLAAGLLALLDLAGLGVGGGGVVAAAIYAAAYLVPLVSLSVWPPRWTLPVWARSRLEPLPPLDDAAPAGAVPALHGERGHASLARWAWRVDAVPGMAWVEDGWLRFRSRGDGDGRPVVDDESAAELRLSAEGEMRLESPRGGWWGRDLADVELRSVDRCRVRATRPWRRDGLVTVEVEGRRSLSLWVADAARVGRQLRDGR